MSRSGIMTRMTNFSGRLWGRAHIHRMDVHAIYRMDARKSSHLCQGVCYRLVRPAGRRKYGPRRPAGAGPGAQGAHHWAALLPTGHRPPAVIRRVTVGRAQTRLCSSCGATTEGVPARKSMSVAYWRERENWTGRGSDSPRPNLPPSLPPRSSAPSYPFALFDLLPPLPPRAPAVPRPPRTVSIASARTAPPASARAWRSSRACSISTASTHPPTRARTCA